MYSTVMVRQLLSTTEWLQGTVQGFFSFFIWYSIPHYPIFPISTQAWILPKIATLDLGWPSPHHLPYPIVLYSTVHSFTTPLAPTLTLSFNNLTTGCKKLNKLTYLTTLYNVFVQPKSFPKMFKKTLKENQIKLLNKTSIQFWTPLLDTHHPNFSLCALNSRV